MPDPDRAFRALLSVAALAVTVLIGGSVRLLLAGAEHLGPVSGGPDVWCLLVPTTGDAGTHLLSYLFLAPMILGALIGLRSVISQQRKGNLLGTCLTPQETGESWSKLSRSAAKLRVASRVTLVRSTDLRAFCFGLLQPRIWVTTALAECLTEPELEAVLLHEKYHLEKLDPLKVAVGKIAASSLFFLPIVKSFYARYLIAKELAADEAAVREQGQRRSLASALDKLLVLNGAVPSNLLREAEGVGLINHRIDSLLGEASVSWGGPSSSAVAVSLLVLALGMIPLIAPVSALHGLALFGLGSQGLCHLA